MAKAQHDRSEETTLEPSERNFAVTVVTKAT